MVVSRCATKRGNGVSRFCASPVQVTMGYTHRLRGDASPRSVPSVLIVRYGEWQWLEWPRDSFFVQAQESKHRALGKIVWSFKVGAFVEPYCIIGVDSFFELTRPNSPNRKSLAFAYTPVLYDCSDHGKDIMHWPFMSAPKLQSLCALLGYSGEHQTRLVIRCFSSNKMASSWLVVPYPYRFYLDIPMFLA